MEVNFIHPPFSIIGRTLAFLLACNQDCQLTFLFPMWDIQPWFGQLINFMDCTFVLPARRNKAFECVFNFPGPAYIKQDHWRFLVGLKNMTV